MKRFSFILSLVFILVGSTQMLAQQKMGKMYQSVPKGETTILQTGKDKMYCPNCGMYLPKFWKTSHAVEFNDGTFRQFCSIYCLAEQLEITELRGKENTIKKYLVVDVTTNKYIDASKAVYVVGSSKKGTMTTTSKYAFKNKKDAEAFSAKNGGTITDFTGAYKLALKGFARDTGLVAAKRGTKMYKMGKKLYDTTCDKAKIEAIDAHTMGEMKALIDESNACNLKSKGMKRDTQLQAIMLYYWDVRLDNFKKLYGENEEIKKHAETFKKKFQQMEKK